MRILFCGHITRPWMSGAQRLAAMKALGSDLVTFDQAPYLRSQNRVQVWLRGPFPDAEAFNRDLVDVVRQSKPDVIWFEWPRMVTREAIAVLRQAADGVFVVGFQDDNPFGTRSYERKYWSRYIEALPDYDLHLVKRTSDLTEFQARGARQVELFEHGTVPEFFHPPTQPGVTKDYDVSFIGTPIDRRVGVISRLHLKHRLPVHVFGNSWNRRGIHYLRRSYFHPAAVESTYADAVWRSKISLGFVSHSNGDDYTMRSFELPACGAFFLAERTAKHQDLYREGVEAEFFSDADECADKIRFFLAHPEQREAIALAGCRKAHSTEFLLRTKMAKTVARLKDLTAK